MYRASSLDAVISDFLSIINRMIDTTFINKDLVFFDIGKEVCVPSE